MIDIPARLTIAAHELNMLLRIAGRLGVQVHADLLERNGWTEVIIMVGEK